MMLRLPTIVNGMDINDIAQVALPHMTAMFEGIERGESKQLDNDAINAELVRLPDGPDESID